MPMTHETTPPNLTRCCTVRGIVIRTDGLVCTFDATCWLSFCAQVVETADGIWARDKRIARVFGCEDERGLEEHTIVECRLVVAAHGAAAIRP